MANVTVIPAKINSVMGKIDSKRKKRRVAGYARVSTDSDEQFTSYEAQVDYYTKFIQANPDWEFVKVYTDEGISGLNTKNRDGFNTMIADALAGRQPLRPQHCGQPDYGAEAQGEGCGGVLPEREYLYAGLQR